MSHTHEKPQEDDAHEANNLVTTEVTLQEHDPGYFYHRDPGYRPWLRPAGPRKLTPYEEILAMMARHLNYAVFFSRCAFIFSIVIVFDFALPNTSHQLEVTGYNTSSGGTIQMKLNDGSVINISKREMRKMKSKSLTISRTRLFGIPYEMTDKENNTTKLQISIYGNFIFMPIILLLTSFTGVVYQKGVEFRFNLGVASLLLAILNITFFHIHKF